jgi:hypothetical protein
MSKYDDKTEQHLRGLWDQMKARAKGMSIVYGPGYDNKPLSREEEKTLFRQRALSVEQEHELWRATNQDGSPMYTPERIGQLVFDQREKLAKSGGRIEPKQWIKYLNDLAAEVEDEDRQTAAASWPAEGM